MADYGINDEFIKNLGKTIPKGSSALFMLIRRSTRGSQFVFLFARKGGFEHSGFEWLNLGQNLVRAQPVCKAGSVR